MSEVTNIENTLLSNFNTWLEEHFPQNSGLKKLKLEQSERFVNLGIPARKSEAYKYTNIQRILSKNFDFSVANEAPAWTKAECHGQFYDVDANHLVFINGQFVEDYSKISSSSSELIIRLLDDKTFEEHTEVKDLLGKTRNIDQDAFASLNLSYFNQGLYLNVPKNADSRDVYVYHFVDAEAAQAVIFPLILVQSETGSRLKIYEKTFTKGENNILSINLFEAKVLDNAELRYSKLQNQVNNYYTIDGIYASQHKDSRFYTNTFSFKAGAIRNNIYINIEGQNSEAHMNGLYQIAGTTHVDNNTSVDHLVPNCFSNELYKGIVDENARGVFNGKIYVRPDAQKTNAFQSNNNILLTDTATVNTKPQLEIWADDVKCSHGCTTGQLDEEAIFYLRSRGVGKKEAKAMLLNAFAKEALAELKSDLLKEEIENIILNKLS